MDREEVTKRDETLRKSQIAMRCAKSAMLLLSLSKSSSPNLRLETPDLQEEEKKKMMMKIQNLRIELTRERMKNRKMKLCSLMEFVLQILLLLSLWSLALLLAFPK
ncbi:hypothetical protein Ancab_036373 [Ancistrocladus abbreviatus]